MDFPKIISPYAIKLRLFRVQHPILLSNSHKRAFSCFAIGKSPYLPTDTKHQINFFFQDSLK